MSYPGKWLIRVRAIQGNDIFLVELSREMIIRVRDIQGNDFSVFEQSKEMTYVFSSYPGK